MIELNFPSIWKFVYPIRYDFQHIIARKRWKYRCDGFYFVMTIGWWVSFLCLEPKCYEDTPTIFFAIIIHCYYFAICLIEQFAKRHNDSFNECFEVLKNLASKTQRTEDEEPDRIFRNAVLNPDGYQFRKDRQTKARMTLTLHSLVLIAFVALPILDLTFRTNLEIAFKTTDSCVFPKLSIVVALLYILFVLGSFLNLGLAIIEIWESRGLVPDYLVLKNASKRVEQLALLIETRWNRLNRNV